MLKLRDFFVRLYLRLTGPNSGVALLVTAAVGAVAFTLIAGTVVYGNTRRLIASAEEVQHTQEALASLQRTSILTERIEYRSRLYLVTSEEEQLNRARSSANLLDTTVVHLKALVADNPSQNANLQSLAASAKELKQLVDAFTPTAKVPEIQIQHCQLTISLMVDQEQSLLTERSKGSQRSSFASIGTDIAFIAIALVTLVVLFGFLLRDSLLRQKIGRQTSLSNERLARTVNALEDRAHESELLTSARDELQLCVAVDQVYQSATQSIARLVTGTSGSLCMINNSRQLVEVVSTWRGSGVGAGVDAESAVDDFHTPESCCGLRSGQPRWRRPGVSEIHCAHFSGEPPESYLCMPIVAHGNTLGVLYLQCGSDREVALVLQRMDGLRQLVQLTGMAIATLNLRTRLENQSIRDSLTGLFNRHFMQISLERELSRAARRKQILAVFMLDLDHFKKFNDAYGHAAGDSVLRAVAEIFRSSIRTEDIACRYGGEEFTIMLPDVTPAVAYERAECIRRAVANLHMPFEEEVYGEFTVSIGVALYPNDGEAADELLRRSDQALYRAKRLGRNQVAIYEASAPIVV